VACSSTGGAGRGSACRAGSGSGSGFDGGACAATGADFDAGNGKGLSGFTSATIVADGADCGSRSLPGWPRDASVAADGGDTGAGNASSTGSADARSGEGSVSGAGGRSPTGLSARTTSGGCTSASDRALALSFTGMRASLKNAYSATTAKTPSTTPPANTQDQCRTGRCVTGSCTLSRPGTWPNSRCFSAFCSASRIYDMPLPAPAA